MTDPQATCACACHIPSEAGKHHQQIKCGCERKDENDIFRESGPTATAREIYYSWTGKGDADMIQAIAAGIEAEYRRGQTEMYWKDGKSIQELLDAERKAGREEALKKCHVDKKCPHCEFAWDESRERALEEAAKIAEETCPDEDFGDNCHESIPKRIRAKAGEGK